MADVPDPRVDAIADAQDIPRRMLAQVQVVDIPGLAAGAGQGEGLGGQALGQLRQMDALIHVVRAFANADVPHPEEKVDPLADAEAIDIELALAIATRSSDGWTRPVRAPAPVSPPPRPSCHFWRCSPPISTPAPPYG